MKILSMTATFGKLEHQTITFEPGLNIIQAPNEWGKSTWCAFLVAMLYGIETRVHSTKAALADKERYAPWSGSPMSGRIDFIWESREITIERRTKGRIIFGDFKAYETATGLPVPELTASNCGQMLLGVEKSVFLRAGFLKLTDLPVTQDESLRRRLNALVTTGDESGASDTLSQKLRDLKNRCRFNKTGLLPQAETQRDQLKMKFAQLHALQDQVQRYKIRQGALEEHILGLENHRDALKYAASRTYAQKLAAAEASRDMAADKAAELRSICAALPAQDEAERTLVQLRQLRDNWDSLHMESQMLPSPPQQPQVPSCFRDLAPEDALTQAAEDRQSYDTLLRSRKKSSPVLLIIAALLLLVGAGLLIASLYIPAAAALAVGSAVGIAYWVNKASVSAHNKQLDAKLNMLQEKYRPLEPDQWQPAAEDYASTMHGYFRAVQKRQNDRGDLDNRLSALKQQLNALTEGLSLQACQEKWDAVLGSWKSLENAQREYHRAEEFLQALVSSHKEVPAPRFPDALSFSEAETAKLLSDAAAEQRQLQLKLGQCLGQMETLGQESQLTQQLEAVQARISKLEDTYAALVLAQETLSDASNALQRRFAPRISQRAQALFRRLTGDRYDRLALGEDLSVSTGAKGEDTLHTALWRSDGTADQLYLALRLAVAEELTPNAPLILDDALVRFDDTRLASALKILKEEAQSKQILLFTCQDRENRLLKEASL